MTASAGATVELPKPPTLSHGPVRPFLDCQADWDLVYRGSDCRPEYASTSVRYYMEYFGFSAGKVRDLSYVAYLDGKPIAILPLFAATDGTRWTLTSSGADVMGPAFVTGLPEKIRKSVVDSHFRYICEVATTLGLPQWHNVDYCDANGLSLWHRTLVERGTGAAFSHDLFLDLKLSDDEIKKNLRKSWRSFFNQIDKHWKIEVIQDADDAGFGEFHALHVQVAGRETRSEATWHLQNEAVGKKQAFWVGLRSHEDNALIGAAYFMLGPKTAYYGVGAYDRSKFSDAPIGHLAQFAALKTMRELGIEWYHLGERPYRATHPEVDDKVLSIAHFKEGMASHLYTRVRTSVSSAYNSTPVQGE